MASLPVQMLWSLVHACTAARIDRDSLLAALPPEVVAGIPMSDTQAKQLFHAWCHLNKMSWPSHLTHPMKDALETGWHLARPLGLADSFRAALDHFAEPATLDRSKQRAFNVLFTRRTKEAYLESGCRVTPGLDGPPGPFMVEHPDRRTSIVAVFHREADNCPSVEATIGVIRQWLTLARSSGEDAEGYVALTPSAWTADREEVRRAGLFPIDYRERRSLSLDAVERVVRCLLGAEGEAAGTPFSIIQGGEAHPAEDAFASFSRDFHTRVWLLLRPRDSEMDTFARELFRIGAQSFLRNGPPALVPLGMTWRARRTIDCGCDVFARHGVPVAPITLEPMLKEGVLCPMFVYEPSPLAPSVTDPSMALRLAECLSPRAKALVVLSPEDVASARHIEGSLRSAGYDARLLRAISEDA